PEVPRSRTAFASSSASCWRIRRIFLNIEYDVLYGKESVSGDNLPYPDSFSLIPYDTTNISRLYPRDTLRVCGGSPP
ncbi:hypothetical protein J6A32_03435, partial [Methanocorpusculum sp.]|nr:hypothetical protein [Methanocorpusculum sp.]